MTPPDTHARVPPELLATREDLRREIREEGERLRAHMTMLMERQGRKILGLIDAIELMKYIDSQTR